MGLAALLGLAALAAPAPSLPSPGLPAGAADPAPRRPARSELETGAVAPEGTWPVAGGAPARTRATRTQALRGELERAWTLDLDGRLEGEPLVWSDWVVLALARPGTAGAPATRALQLVDLVAGRAVGAPVELASPVPATPSLWAGTLVAREGPGTLGAWHLSPGGLERRWSAELGGAVGPPLLVETELYVVAAESETAGAEAHASRAAPAALERWSVGAGAPDWRVPGRFRGAVSLRGADVWAIDYDDRGTAWLVRVARADGAVRSRTYVGFHGADERAVVPALGALPEVALLERECLVTHALPVGVYGASTRTLALPFPPPDGAARPRRTGSHHTVAPAAWRDGWIGRVADPRGGVASPGDARPGASWLLSDGADERVQVLADRGLHPAVCAHAAPAAVAGGTAYLAARAVDLATFRVLWNLEDEIDGPAIPARDTVLFPVGDARLVAYRSRGLEREQQVSVCPEPRVPGGDVQCGHAVLRDGTVESGDFEVRPDEDLVVRHGADRRRRPIGEVLFLGLEDGRIAFAAGERSILRGIERMVDEELAAGYGELLADARETGDPALLARVLADATAHDAPAAELAAARARLAELAAAPAADATTDPARVARVLEAERLLARRPAEITWRYAAQVSAERCEGLWLELVRDTLRRDPAHEGARALVRELLPHALRDRAAADPLAWIDWLATVERTPVRIVAPSASPATPAERALAEAARAWRPDLVGFESAHLLVVSPLQDPGAIARAVATGELVCAALEELFGAPPARAPLVVHLYPTREEYLAQSAGTTPEEGAGLAWSAGHHDARAGVSRLWLPPAPEAWESVRETLAHELTHHWLAAHLAPSASPVAASAAPGASGAAAPAAPDASGPRADLPGYWVVEGFAAMVEEFRFDLERRAWTADNPRSNRLDLVANAPAAALVDWAELCAASQLDFQRLPATEPGVAVDSTWYLGLRRRVTPRHMFYNQAAALCRWLFDADDGAHRAALLDYVAAVYAGCPDRLDVRTAFGLDPEELGRRAIEHARAAQRK